MKHRPSAPSPRADRPHWRSTACDDQLVGQPRRRSDRAEGIEGWGAEVSSIVAEENLFSLDGPIVRVTTPHVPLPAADALEDAAVPNVARIVEGVRRALA